LRSAASDARRSRRRTSGSHHSRSVPPGRSSPRTSLLLALEDAKLGLDVAAEVVVRLAGREGAAGARVPGDERLERVGLALEEDLGQPGRRHRTERVAVPAGILGGDQALSR
jgi:hypothetical protein